MGCEIIQLTDMETPAIDGCSVVRAEWIDNPMIFKMQRLADLEGDILALDTDVVVNADLSPVFAFPFDVALTWRDGPIYAPDGTEVTQLMPINCGVMFCRNPEFWKACLEWCNIHEVKEWCADQLAVPRIQGFNVLRLHCDNFNYTPFKQHEDLSRRLVVHYKGERKAWMLI
jgi:hypothetical protein